MLERQAIKSNGGTDWQAIKTQFVSGVEYAKLAETHNLKEAAIRQRASRGDWSQARHSMAQAVTDRAINAIIDVKADLLAELNKTDLSAAQSLRDKANGLIELVTTANELKALAGTFDSAQKISRLALGAATENTNVTQRTLEPLQDTDFLG